MMNRYGSNPDQIHPFFKEKREWSKVKDRIVRDYVTCYLKTITHRGRPIIIVDAFAGPGRFGDGTDGSPLIICKAIESAASRGGVGTACLFADSHPAHRVALSKNLASYIKTQIADEPLADFSDAMSRALGLGSGSTLFFYLDPFGIKELRFDTVRQIYQRNKRQSTEVLINFSFRTFMRMSGNWDYNDSASDVAQKVKEGKIDTVNSVMGGDYWRDIVTDRRFSTTEREDAVMYEYRKRIGNFFDYAYSIPVKERDTSQETLPSDALAKYHLVFGTRNPRAVVYMNDVALNALTPYLKTFKDGLLFNMTPERYSPSTEDEVKNAIVREAAACPLTRPQIYERIIPKYFMQRLKKDYRAMIDSLVFSEGRLYPDRTRMKSTSRLNDAVPLSGRP